MNKAFIIFLLSLFFSSCSLDNLNTKNNTGEEDVKIFVDKGKEKERAQRALSQDFASGSSASKNYEHAIKLINSGDRVAGINILQDLVNKFPNYKKARVALDKLESPFSLAASIVEKYIDNWINSPSKVKKFTAVKPKFPKLPKNPILKKGEFEKTIDFNIRVREAQKKYQQQLNAIKASYESKVNKYNEDVANYNSAIDWERKTRAEKVPAMRKRYLDTAFAEVLGNPRVVNLEYNADKEVFYGQIVSQHDNLKLNIEVPIVITKAKNFKKNVKNLKPSVKVDLIDGNVVFSDVSIKDNGATYPAKLTSSKIKVKESPEVTIDGKIFGTDIFDVDVIKPLKVKQIKKNNRQFFIPKI